MAEGGSENEKLYDLIVVGAGPVGLACGAEGERRKLSCLILEKGCLTNSLFHFPKHMTWFSTPELLEIGDIPFTISTEKPTRHDTLIYYRKVAEHFNLRIHLYEEVTRIARDGYFVVTTHKARYHAKHVVLATGAFDHPNYLNIPGEDLPKVSHYYDEPFLYFRQQVAVIGGKSSAADTALDLYRHGAQVTLIHRVAELSPKIKYWVRPNLLNRIRDGKIKAYFNAEIIRIREHEVDVRCAEGTVISLANDFVFAMTGYHSDSEFLRRVGIVIDDRTLRATFDPETFETNVPGVYISGIAAAGIESGDIFIENGRVHAKMIVADIAAKLERKFMPAAVRAHEAAVNDSK